jgi:hypothetical protein
MEECLQSFGRENPEGKNLQEHLDVVCRIILKWILDKQDGECGLDQSGSG